MGPVRRLCPVLLLSLSLGGATLGAPSGVESALAAARQAHAAGKHEAVVAALDSAIGSWKSIEPVDRVGLAQLELGRVGAWIRILGGAIFAPLEDGDLQRRLDDATGLNARLEGVAAGLDPKHPGQGPLWVRLTDARVEALDLAASFAYGLECGGGGFFCEARMREAMKTSARGIASGMLASLATQLGKGHPLRPQAAAQVTIRLRDREAWEALLRAMEDAGTQETRDALLPLSQLADLAREVAPDEVSREAGRSPADYVARFSRVAANQDEPRKVVSSVAALASARFGLERGAFSAVACEQAGPAVRAAWDVLEAANPVELFRSLGLPAQSRVPTATEAESVLGRCGDDHVARRTEEKRQEELRKAGTGASGGAGKGSRRR